MLASGRCPVAPLLLLRAVPVRLPALSPQIARNSSRCASQGSSATFQNVDVLSQEPPSLGNPLLDLNLPNLILTPHVAFASVQSLETLAEQLIGNLDAYAAGTPRHLISKTGQ